MSMNKYLLALVCLGSILLFSCGKVSTHQFTGVEIELLADGPLFEGANFATGDYTVDLTSFLEEHGATEKDIQSIRLVNASLEMTDSINFDIIQEITLSFAGEKADMQKVGVLNPVPTGQQMVKVQIADDQEKIKSFFMEPSFTAVVDFNLNQDTMIDIRLRGNFDFEISLKQ